MDAVKKIAIVVIVASVVVGSAYGLVATSTTAKIHPISITGKILVLSSPISCPGISANGSEWVELDVNANLTDLYLTSMTILTSNPSIDLTITLEQNVSSYVYYGIVNSTYEIVSVPVFPYWPVGGSSPAITITYYFGGVNPTVPTAYTVGQTKVVSGTLNC